MYVNGCQICSALDDVCGPQSERERHGRSTIESRRNAMTLAATIILIAGVNGPGPNE